VAAAATVVLRTRPAAEADAETFGPTNATVAAAPNAVQRGRGAWMVCAKVAVYRTAGPAPAAVSAVAATARMAPALLLVFRRLLSPALLLSLALAASEAAAHVSEKLLVERTAREAALIFRVPPPATVLLGITANRLGAGTCVLGLLRCVLESSARELGLPHHKPLEVGCTPGKEEDPRPQ